MTKKVAKIINEQNKSIDLEFCNVSKWYYLVNNDLSRLLLLLFESLRKKRLKNVLTDINFKIYKSDRVALIGLNGVGKSTIMHLIIGGTIQNKGEIKIYRRISSLLDVIAGMEEKFTGRENIYIKGAIFGYTKKEIDACIDRIIEFSELGPYIDQEIMRYSYGMKCKLGFSINIFLKPQILLIDEALSVGDEAFNLKAKNKLLEMSKNDDITILIISHNTQTLANLCNRGIYLKDGQIVFDGAFNDAIEMYHNDQKTNDQKAKSKKRKNNKK